MEKRCSECKEIKPTMEFCRDKRRKEGINYKCKKCSKILYEKYYKSKDGVIKTIYRTQKINSKKRGHSLPSYTFEELNRWMSENGFDNFYREWVLSGFSKDKKPSIDRLDNRIGYTIKNIRLGNWRQNKENYYAKTSHGIGVNQCSLDGVILNTFKSASEASKSTGIYRTGITRCCNGTRKTAGKFKWTKI